MELYEVSDTPKVTLKNRKPEGVDMPKVLSFDSKDEIVAALKKRKWEDDRKNAAGRSFIS